MTRVALVACSETKLGRRAPARELYTGHLFRLSLRYAEPRADRVFVLSALHGLLALDQAVDPYDYEMRNRAPAERRLWAARVLIDLILAVGTPTTLEVLAGEAYVAPLHPLLLDLELRHRWPAPRYPLGRLEIGDRKRWLCERLDGR